MATTDDKAVLLDTNVLLSATTPSRRLHRAALRVLNEWPNRGYILMASPQVLREYMVVASRPVEVNGLAQGMEVVLANIAALRGRVRLLSEGGEVLDRLADLIAVYGCVGKQIHDANVVATALAAGETKVMTDNLRDFSRFAPEIEVIDLATLP
ncbi:MAG TPA: PIN domain-containing protein [Thermoanaerobaculia bacterium]|nr:PIN domain-containing protein [Thermoanaerobaculia bacterium]